MISDPVLAKEGEEILSPVNIELWCRDTICAFYKDVDFDGSYGSMALQKEIEHIRQLYSDKQSIIGND